MTEFELHAYVDDALPPPECERVRRYLEAHPAAAERVESYRAQNRALQILFGPVEAKVEPKSDPGSGPAAHKPEGPFAGATASAVEIRIALWVAIVTGAALAVAQAATCL